MTQTSDSTGTTERVARFAAELTIASLPAPVVDFTKLIVLDTVGAMLAASSPRYPAGQIIGEFARSQHQGADSTLIGTGDKVSAVGAALANGTLGYYCDIEAHHPEAVLHSAAAVVPTALAVGEREGRSGADFMAAVVAGADVGCRTSLAIKPTALYARGFHPSAVAGALGTAAAAGRLLSLSTEGMQRALGLAGTQAAGLLAWETDPTENSRPFNPGIAARNGATAALLAALDFGGPPDIYFGKFDLFGAYADDDGGAPERLTDGLGESFAIMEFAIKFYPCCAFLHPGLDALFGILHEETIAADEVEQIVLRFPTSGVQLIDNNPLKSHCGQYILPIAVLDGEVRVDDILHDRRADPRVDALSRRTQVLADDALDEEFPMRYATIVEIAATGGRRFSRRVDYALGCPENPATVDDVRAKFRRLAGTVAAPERVEAIIELVDRLEDVADVGELAALCGRQG
jgi:2-methylcitrate dehydratase PrpD